MLRLIAEPRQKIDPSLFVDWVSRLALAGLGGTTATFKGLACGIAVFQKQSQLNNILEIKYSSKNIQKS